ncbi:MAG TPA: molybdopterin-guanine dinucleotide biosynthesis protein B [Phycisphaerae bacterium]|nr:molybdopterin-guanine dinucleotide biosynthesis protein B [Phycisphaerae bacterium]
MTVPPILCITGRSGSGKTHLLERLIGRLTADGLRVGAIKHCGHVAGGDSEKDSARLAHAGASPAVAAGAHAVEIRNARQEPPLTDLAAAFCRGCDLVLAEGYRRSVYDKILLSGGQGPDRTHPSGSVQLIVGEGEQIARDDLDAIVAFVLSWYEQRRALSQRLLGIVLTGGGSRRMGFDKSRLKIGGVRILGRLCELLADRIGEVAIIGRPPEWNDIPICARWHPDTTPGAGPLGGIATALRVAAAGDPPRGVCVAACDMPAVSGDLLDYLLGGRDPGAAASVPWNPKTGMLEPLFAVYEPQSLPSIEQALHSGRLSVTDWLSSEGAHRLLVPDELGDQMANVNTPEDLDAMRSGREGNSL